MAQFNGKRIFNNGHLSHFQHHKAAKANDTKCDDGIAHGTKLIKILIGLRGKVLLFPGFK